MSLDEDLRRLERLRILDQVIRVIPCKTSKWKTYIKDHKEE